MLRRFLQKKLRRLLSDKPRATDRTNRRPLRRRLAIETLEDRQLLAVTLTWAGAGNALGLTENTAGATPAIILSEPDSGVNSLRIDLGSGNVFAADSTVTAAGLAYQNADSPATSQYATIDIGVAGNVSSIQAALPGDALTLGPIPNVNAGVGSIVASAGAMEVTGVDTFGNNGSVDLKATGDVTVDPGALVQAGTISLAADTQADGTGDDGTGTLAILSNAGVYGGSIAIRGAEIGIDSTAGVGNASGTIFTTLAGSVGESGSRDGTGTAALFNYPSGVTVDSAGNVYVADSYNEEIRKITPNGVVTTLAGVGHWGSQDGAGAAASFDGPQGVAVDSAGNVYVADMWNREIRKITSDGTVTTLAGAAGQSGSQDGTGAAASFDYPEGVAVDSAGNVYVADTYNHEIRKITPDGIVSTLAGTARQWGSQDGVGTAASFDGPCGVTVDSEGNVYVADTWNNAIRKITPDGVVTTLVGPGAQNGGAAEHFNSPCGVTVDGAGNVYVADKYNSAIRKISPLSVAATGQVTIRSSLPSRPMSLGGGADDVSGVNLTDAELACIRTTATGTVTIGDAGQTGNITFTTATPATTAGAATVVLQAVAGTGQITLDDANSGTGLDGNDGTVTLAPGTGGIVLPLGSSPYGVPLASQGFNATGLTLHPMLNFAPSPGMRLMLIDNTATPATGNSIIGTFANLPQGSVVSASGDGVKCVLEANYLGGDGNDLMFTNVSTSTIATEILGDGQPGFWSSASTTWTTSTEGLDGGSLVSSPSNGSQQSQAAWWFSMPAGVYEIDMTWPAASSLTANLGLDLYDGVGNFVGQIPVNEQVAPNDFTDQGVPWKRLGSIKLTNNIFHISTWNRPIDGAIAIDAIRLRAAPTVDDADAPGPYQYYPAGSGTFTTTGAWTSVSQGAMGGSHVSSSAAGSGTSTATWTMPVVAGYHEVDVTWSAGVDLSTNVTYDIYDGATKLDSVTVNQQSAPVDFTDDGIAWKSLGSFTVSSGVLTITVANAAADGQVSADAVRILPAYQPTEIVNNGSPGSWLNANWTTIGQGLFGDALVSNSAPGSTQSQAAWWFPCRPGQYDVQVTWQPGGNDSQAAGFNVYNALDFIRQVPVNERNAPSGATDQGVAWQSLGVFTMTSNVLHVSIWNNAVDGPICVDGIRIVPVAG